VSSYDVHVASFDELAGRTSYALWRLRESVFVVEQECAYQELDGRDVEPGTRHVWATVNGADAGPDPEADPGAGDEPVGYLRLLDEGHHVRIGRVLVAKGHRGHGLSGTLMETALRLVGDRASVLDAQTPLAGWYSGYGYRRTGPDFLDDGILHTPMRRPAG